MLADETRPGVEELYLGSVLAPNLRVGNDSSLKTPGDMTAAAGMNRHRLGLALLRLQSEWSSAAAKLAPPTAKEIERLARTYTLETAQPNAGKVRVVIPSRTPRRGEDPASCRERIEYVLPLRLAKRERQAWHEHELGLLLMQLRSLPALRDAMLLKAERQGWNCDAHVVAKVLLWWLGPKCTVCGGNREGVIAGTGRTNGKPCRSCRGTGVQDPPHGRDGERLAGYIRGCLAAARNELREGVYRERRTLAGESKRLFLKE
jgi:hypothetical protein